MRTSEARDGGAKGATLKHDLEVVVDSDVLARRGATLVGLWARKAVKDHGQFTFAVSGGRTPWAMFKELVYEDMPWEQTVIYQVDERVAPDGDPDRNLTHLKASLGTAPARVEPMPVLDADLEAAAAAYAKTLPESFDLIHLGLGPDGHTASLVPNDPVLDVTDKLVGLTQPYQGHPRMTLTYPALARAEQLLWLVSGDDKHDPLARLLAGETGIPAGRVEAGHSFILADESAA